MRYLACVSVLSATLLAGKALAESNIDPNHRSAWCESLGWSDWRGDGVGSGAIVHGTILSGAVWLENAGWIILGDGSPVDGVHYGNVDAADFGVNIAADGDLYGLAWGENIGWVNFDTASAGVYRARLKYCQQLGGYVWTENAGWIDLDDATWFVGLDPSVAPPATIPSLALIIQGGDTFVTWSLDVRATAIDLARGELIPLSTSGGNFTVATTDCSNDLIGGDAAADTDTPPAGQGYYYVARDVNCGGAGTYNSGDASQVGSRDAEIDASANACP